MLPGLCVLSKGSVYARKWFHQEHPERTYDAFLPSNVTVYVMSLVGIIY
jgi:hypothetical protein